MEGRGTGQDNMSCTETMICNKWTQQTKGPVQYFQMLRLLETKETILSPQEKKSVLLWLFWKSPLPWMAATPKNSKHAANAHGSASSFINMRFWHCRSPSCVYWICIWHKHTSVCFCWISQSTQCGVYASFMLTGGQTLPDSVQCLPECVKHIWTSIESLCLFSAWLHMAVMSFSSIEWFLGQIFLFQMKLWFKT